VSVLAVLSQLLLLISTSCEASLRLTGLFAHGFALNTPLRSKQGLSSTPSVWYLDGSNLLGHHGTPHRIDTWLETLQAIAQSSSQVAATTHIQLIYMVLDDNPSLTIPINSPSISTKDMIDYEVMHTESEALKVVQLPKGISADDFIVDCLQYKQYAQNTDPMSSSNKAKGAPRLYVVTADRELRQRVSKQRSDVVIINPKTFWRRYVPRLSGAKKTDSA
jgi:rRNA-processing protein FCF1